jgi:uncharacterized protein YjbI with pentapeptide repeats
MTNQTIKHRYTGAVLFDGESGMTTRQMLEKSILNKVSLDGASRAGASLDGASLAGARLAGANLAGARLAYANLIGANLIGANLDGANLIGANLIGANLAGASLIGANLAGANLDGANLAGANLDGANLAGAKLSFGKAIGSRPYFAIGPIGSRCDYAKLWITDKGPFVQAGCFTGTLEKFNAACIKTHGDTDHGKEYAMAVLMFEAHANLWTPNQLEIAK